MSLIVTKIIVAVLFGVVRFIAGVLPIKLYHFLKRWEHEDDSLSKFNKRHNQLNCGIALCQAFGGGVLFATCFLHMMPEVFREVEQLKFLNGSTSNYPLSQLIICVGFFIVYFVEEISNWFITKVPDEPCQSSKTNKVSPSKGKIFVIDANETNNKNIDDVVGEINEQDLNQIPETIPFDNISLTSNGVTENGTNYCAIGKEKIEDKVKTKQQFLRGVLVIVALILHSFFEGLAIGLQHSNATIWYLFVAVSIHSAIILFCIAVEFILARTKMTIIYINVTILALASPLGIVLGLLITLNSDMNSRGESTTIILLEGLSTGTILYITFFEVLNREKHRRIYRIRRGLCILGGFVLMALLQFIK